METSDNDLAGEEGTMKKTTGLMFRIASKSEYMEENCLEMVTTERCGLDSHFVGFKT